MEAMKDLIPWASGLFEGEGNIHKRDNCLRLKMCDYDIVKRFRDVFGVGTLVAIPTSNPKHKDIYEWKVYGMYNTRRILGMMLPYFGERRAYAALNRLDLIESKLWS